MSEFPLQQNRSWLMGALCLCMIPGCVGPGARARMHSVSNAAPQIDTSIPAPVESTNVVSSDASCKVPSCDRRVTTAAWQPDETPSQPQIHGEVAGPSISEDLPAPSSAKIRRLSLRDAVDTALIQNLDAVTARAAGPVSYAGRIVAATYPWNPTVQVGVDPYTRDRDGNFLATKNQVSVTQTFELAHQTRYRRQAADAGWSQQRAVIAQSELTAAVAAIRAYFDASYHRGLLELTTSTAELQLKILGIVDRRFNAGLATPTERLTASVAARQSKRLAELADAQYQAALSTLRIVLNYTGDDQIEIESPLDSYKWLAANDVLDQGWTDGMRCDDGKTSDASFQWISNRPDVVAARFAVSAARANLDLAKANMVPNIATGPTYERDESGTLFFGVAAQVDLPVWNTGYPLVRLRTAELQQQLIVWRQTRARAASQAQAAVRRYMVAHRLWDEQWAKKDAGAGELVTATNAFEQGQATILEVLSIQDSLLQERKSYLDLLNEISQAAADMIAALAIDPELLINAPTGNTSGSAIQQ
jgi:outer membrane protein TolC